MNYIESIRKNGYQEFNSVSDFIDYNEELRDYKKIRIEYSVQEADKLSKKMKLDNNLFVLLGTFLFLLKRYGRQNSIVLELRVDNKILPIGLETKETETFNDLITKLSKELIKYNECEEEGASCIRLADAQNIMNGDRKHGRSGFRKYPIFQS